MDDMIKTDKMALWVITYTKLFYTCLSYVYF
jgi:hypothetical protein